MLSQKPYSHKVILLTYTYKIKILDYILRHS